MIQVKLEKSATLWRDDSHLALKLQKYLENKGYILDVHLSGSQTPILDYDHFFQGYGDIQNLIDRTKND